MRQDAEHVLSQSPGTTIEPPTRGAFGMPTGGASLAAAAVIGGVALVVYAIRMAMAKRKRPAAARLPEPDLASDMQELSDRLAADLDARAARLERLIAAADSRLVELKLQHQGRRTPAPEPATAQATAPMPQEFTDVYKLADRGLSALEIAKRTGRPTGQVQLILNLRTGSVAL